MKKPAGLTWPQWQLTEKLLKTNWADGTQEHSFLTDMNDRLSIAERNQLYRDPQNKWFKGGGDVVWKTNTAFIPR